MYLFFVLVYMVRKDCEKLFSHLELVEPPAGLFDKIILAIKREQELKQTKKLLFGFLFLFVASLIMIPLSWTLLIYQLEISGISYFISTALSDFGTFLTLWREFSLAILESLPIVSILVFVISVGIALFTLRLFLYKKRLLLKYFFLRY